MGTTVASTLIARAASLASDAGYVHWTQNDWLEWLNDGQRAIASLRPSAHVVAQTVNLVAGVLQTLPAAASLLVDIPYNVGGPIIHRYDRAQLDAENPSWPVATASATVEGYVYDPAHPEVFFVTPPQPGTPGSVTAMLATAPADVASVGATIALHDRWVTALLEYMLYRAFSKDDETADLTKADRKYNNFITLVTESA